MKAKKGLVSQYAALGPAALRDATREFDQEMVVKSSRPLNARERRLWKKARRKPGRPRRGAGVKVISVSVERGLLGRFDKLAKALGVSRAALIERGLEAVLAGGSRPR
jgi:hypothetical protein